jgi:hypothetical protein
MHQSRHPEQHVPPHRYRIQIEVCGSARKLVPQFSQHGKLPPNELGTQLETSRVVHGRADRTAAVQLIAALLLTAPEADLPRPQLPTWLRDEG